jgi:rod shape-determining protein MreD
VKVVAHVACALLLVALQAALLRFLGGGVFSIALLVPCVVYVGLNAAGNVEGVLGAAGMGLVQDLVSGTPKGLFTFLWVVLFLAARGVGASVDVRGRAGFALLSFVGALSTSIGALILLRWGVAAELAPGATVLPRILVEALLTAVASPAILAGMRLVDRLFTREEPGLLR